MASMQEAFEKLIPGVGSDIDDDGTRVILMKLFNTAFVILYNNHNTSNVK